MNLVCKLFTTAICFSSALIALEDRQPLNLPSQEMKGQHEILATDLKGVSVIGEKGWVRDTHEYGITIRQLNLPAPEDTLQRLLEPFLGSPVTEESIYRIKEAIIQFYRRYDYPIVFIEVPSQKVSDGFLTLRVHQGKLGEIRSTGNKHFKNERLIGYIQAKPNQPVDIECLIKDLEWMNRNPFRQTNSIFTPSAQNGLTDIELVTEDRFPLRVYAGADNTGIRDTGRTRYFAGFNWGNAFGLDHILSYQFTSGSNYNNYYSHSVNYTAPLSWRHTLVLYGGYSHVKADLDTPNQRTKGYSAQASMRYEIPLPTWRDYLHDFLFGFDYKRTNTSIDQDGDLFFDRSVNVTQFVLGYNGGYETSWYKVSGTIEAYVSPGDWLPDQSRSRYESLREGADNTYIYTRIAVAPTFCLPYDFSIESRFRMQLSSTNLLASEQYGLGGWDTVRGYQVREVNDDNVVILNIEFRSPPIHVIRKLKRKSLEDKLIFLVFWDYAYGWNHETFPGETNHDNLMGVGPGVRYFIGPNITFRGDLGYKVWQPVFSDNHTRWRFEFGVVASY
ncbi:ShlB/FhaC/HecB family hemolysin secretion/activation protein [Simkania sp.]|uniref:ShlB/FhaC/HecB family hemolysin secretion/activation protein n=1 Tax=Simkania sp. TaxID=34094 RepID=UPI003B5190B2